MLKVMTEQNRSQALRSPSNDQTQGPSVFSDVVFIAQTDTRTELRNAFAKLLYTRIGMFSFTEGPLNIVMRITTRLAEQPPCKSAYIPLIQRHREDVPEKKLDTQPLDTQPLDTQPLPYNSPPTILHQGTPSPPLH
jgi:hypothetical protein